MGYSVKRVVMNPRAYLTPFLLLLVFHQLPIYIAYGAINRPAGFHECKRVLDLFHWFDTSFILHVVAGVLLVLSTGVTLCSTVYRVHRPENGIILILLLLYVGNLVWAIYGEGAYPADTSDCANDSDTMQDAADNVTYFQHFDFVFSVVVVALFGCTSYLCGVHTSDDIVEAEKRWQRRCMNMFRMFTCTSTRVHATDEDIFESLGKMLGKFFVVRYKTEKYEGLQFNDLMFCLGLVSKAQKQEREDNEEAERLAVRKYPRGIEELKLRDLAYYGRLAVGMYGWPMYMWYTPLKWFNAFNCFFSKKTEGQVIDHDNVITSNRASFLTYTGLDHSSLVYLNCYNFVFSAPYSIVKDTRRRQLIISVRGSFSFYDFVTDGLAHIVNMNADELPEDVPDADRTSTHYGMLRTARSLFGDLQEGTRKGLFWDFAMEHCVADSTDPWTIVVCGHSMGAGVGSILCLLLRKFFPNTHAYLYAPPMMFDAVTADYTKSFMTSAVYGDDVVPRLSIANVTRLRDEMVNRFNAVAQEKLYKVRYGKSKRVPANKSQPVEIAEMNVDATGSTTPTPGSPVDNETSSDGTARPVVSRDDRSFTNTHTGLLGMDFLRTADIDDVQEVDVPGEIIHILTVNKARACSCTMLLGEQELTYTLREASYFRRIWTTSRALQDHMVHHYDRNIRHLSHCLGYTPVDESRQIIIDVDGERDLAGADESPKADAVATEAKPAADAEAEFYDEIRDFEATTTTVTHTHTKPKPKPAEIPVDVVVVDVDDSQHPYKRLDDVV